MKNVGQIVVPVVGLLLVLPSASADSEIVIPDWIETGHAIEHEAHLNATQPAFGMIEDTVEHGGGNTHVCTAFICVNPEPCGGTTGGPDFRAEISPPVVYVALVGAYAGYSENC